MMKMMMTTIAKGIEMEAVAKSMVHEEMATLADPNLKISMTAIIVSQKVIGRSLSDQRDGRKVIVLKRIGRMVPGDLRGRASTVHNRDMKGRLIRRKMASLRRLRMAHSRQVDFILR